MRIYKHTYTAKDGKARATASYYFDITDSAGRRRRVAGFRDRAATGELARAVERLASLQAAGAGPDRATLRWLETCPPRIRERLERLGLLDRRLAEGSRLIEELLDSWNESILASGPTEAHAQQTVGRVRRLFVRAQVTTWTDLTPEAIESALRAMRESGEIRNKTSSAYLAATKQFCRWMVETGRASCNPVAIVKPVNPRINVGRRRRVATVEELRTLLQNTACEPERYGLSGPERALVYRIAVETGLRAGELKSLRVRDFALQVYPPIITASAAYTKAKREDTFHLRPTTAALLAEQLGGKHPTAQAFALPHRTAKMLYEDLEAAGIEVKDAQDRVLDFHALRHTFITNVAEVAPTVKVAQTLARHSTPLLTLGTYTHLRKDDEVRTLAALPDLDVTEVELPQSAAVGSDLSTSLSNLDDLPCPSVTRAARSNRTDGTKNALCGSGEGTRTPDTRIMIPLL